MTREGPARLAEHDFQQAKLGRRQFHFLFADRYLVADAVDADAEMLDDLGRLGGHVDAPLQRLDPLHQHLHAERLGDIVIRAHGKTHDLIRFLGLGGEHEDGHAARTFAGAQLAANL